MIREKMSAWRLAWTTAGFLVWSAAFVALYAALSIGCEFGWHQMPLVGAMTVQRTVLIVLLLASLGAGYFIVRVAAANRRAAGAESLELKPFIESVAWLAAWAALASTVVSLGPVLFLTACN